MITKRDEIKQVYNDNFELYKALFIDERLVPRKLIPKGLQKSGLLSGDDMVRSTVRIVPLQGLYVATDHVSYQGDEQDEGMVMPFHPENPFLLEEMHVQTGDNVLEIGVGSGINTIYALKQGANHVTTLDVNPRTSELTRRNMELNGIDPSQVDLLLNDSFDLTDLFKPVEGEKFDYIVTNPPFEYGRVDEDDALRNSASGLDGLDMIREIFSQIDTYLTDTGHMQMVFFAPGTSEGPTSLIEAASRLEGKVEIIYKANPMKTADFVKINLGKEMDIPTEHEYYWMGMLHYTRGQDGLSVRAGEEEKNWHLPLYSDVPMMHKHSKIDEVYQDTKKLPVNLSVAKKEER